MEATITPQMQILHALPGRLRVHLSEWTGRGARQIEKRLRRVPGVQRAEANPATKNVLIVSDPRQVRRESLLSELSAAERDAGALEQDEPPAPPVAHERPAAGGRRRARIAVRG